MSTALIVCLGQSNERGTGGAGTASVTAMGPPHRDPIAPNGNQASMWPAMVDSLSRQGIRAIVRNTAKGSSTVSRSWVGMCRTWSADRNVSQGEWALPSTPNGRKYKCSSNTDVRSGMTEPAWPTTVGASVDDNTATWTCALTDENDTDGHKYVEGESGFDPKGLFGVIESYLVGEYDYRIAILQIGQSDAATGTTLDEFRDAYIAATAWFLARDFIVFLGLSTGSTSYVTQYVNNFQPAITDALAYFSGNDNVHRGADLFELFGANPPSSDGGVHVTQEVLRQAGEVWADIISSVISSS